MKKREKKANQYVEDMDDEENLYKGMSEEARKVFQDALSEVGEEMLREIEEATKDRTPMPPSRRHQIQMNRLFRERVGGSFLPFPQADNFYERTRSKIVIKLKINQFIRRRKQRRLMR